MRKRSLRKQHWPGIKVRSWEAQPLKAETGMPVSGGEFQGFVVTVVHEHTETRNQSTKISVAGKTDKEALYSQANLFASSMGYSLREEIDPDRAMPSAARRHWVRARSVKGSGTVEASETETPGAISPAGSPKTEPQPIPFPRKGGSAVCCFTPSKRGGWKTRVWGGAAKTRDAAAIAKGFSASLGFPDNSELVPRRKSAFFGVLFALIGLGAWWVANFLPLAIGAGSVGFAFLWFWQSARRKKTLPPGAVSAAVGKSSGWRNPVFWLPSVFTIGENSAPSYALRVLRDSTVFPNRGGVIVGWDSNNVPVRIPDADRYENMVYVGAPGRGKTTAMLLAAGGDIARMKQGEPHTLIWFETKREGAERLEKIASKAGLAPIRISPGIRGGPQIRFMEWSDPKAAAGEITEALVATFDPGSIQEQSRDVISAALMMSAMIWPDALELAGETDRPNLMRTVWLLLGGKRWDIPRALIEAAEQSPHFPDLFREAKDKYYSYYSLNDNEKDRRMGAARNKFTRLKEIPAWDLDMNMPLYSWKALTESNRPIIIDITDFDSEEAQGYSQELIRILLPLCLYSFWASAKKRCSDWGEQGKSVSIYCDEASNLEFKSGKILTQMATQGRSYGLSMSLGAQGLTHLWDPAKVAFQQSGHKIYFSTPDTDSAEELARDFQDDGYSTKSIQDLKRHHALVKIVVKGENYGPILTYIPPETTLKEEDAWQPSPTQAASKPPLLA